MTKRDADTDNFIDTYYYYVFIERQIVVKTKQNI